MRRLITGLLFASMIATAHARQTQPVPPTSPTLRAIRASMAEDVAKGHLASISVGVIQHGRLIWEESFGFADRAAQRRATPRTRYGLASMGKSITALAVMSLVERGRLGLDTPITQVLGRDIFRAAPCDARPTVRQLINMTSGIPHGAATYKDGAPRPSEELPPARAVLAFCPGTYFYSNFSVAAADRVVEAASGEPFGSYLSRHIFGPLGMSGTALGTPRGYAPPATRYGDDGTAITGITTLPRSSRGMYSTLDDLLRYVRFQLGYRTAANRRVLSRAGLDALHYSRSGAPGSIMALGWGSLELTHSHWLISNGSDMGVQSSIVLVPEADLGIVVLSNSSGDQADDYAVKLADALAPGFAADVEAAKTKYLSQIVPFTATQPWSGHWVGTIAAPGGPLTIAIEIGADNMVTMKLGDQPPHRVEDAKLGYGMLTGHFQARLPLEEAAPGDHYVDVALVSDGTRITGFLTANFANEHGKFELPAPVVLVRR